MTLGAEGITNVRGFLDVTVEKNNEIKQLRCNGQNTACTLVSPADDHDRSKFHRSLLRASKKL